MFSQTGLTKKDIRFVILFYETLDQYFAKSPVVKQASAYLSLTTALFCLSFPFQSGSQNDLLSDAAWSPEDSPASPASSSSAAAAARLGGLSGAPAAGAPGAIGAGASACAEYPFHMNLCLPAQAVNFDLTHKRGKKKKKDPPLKRGAIFFSISFCGQRALWCPILSREERGKPLVWSEPLSSSSRLSDQTRNVGNEKKGKVGFSPFSACQIRRAAPAPIIPKRRREKKPFRLRTVQFPSPSIRGLNYAFLPPPFRFPEAEDKKMWYMRWRKREGGGRMLGWAHTAYSI